MLNPGEFIKRYAEAGRKKAQAPAPRLFLLALLAGAFIALAGAAANTAVFGLGTVSLTKLVSALLFPFGLIMVVFSGAELFTGNCLLLIAGLEGSARWRDILKNLGIVYLGNFAGATLTAAACVYAGQLSLGGGALAAYTITVAAGKCGLGFGRALLLGLLCNVLVCAGVVFAFMAGSAPGKAIGAYAPVCLFVLCGFEHSIANMYYIPAGLLAMGIPEYAALAAGSAETLSWTAFLLNNLLPVTLGNLAGGLGFALLLWLCHGRWAVKQDTAGAVRL